MSIYQLVGFGYLFTFGSIMTAAVDIVILVCVNMCSLLSMYLSLHPGVELLGYIVTPC